MSWSVQKKSCTCANPKPFFFAQSFAQGATHAVSLPSGRPCAKMIPEYRVMCNRNVDIFQRHLRLSLPWVLLLEIVALAPKPEHVELENYQAEGLGSIES